MSDNQISDELIIRIQKLMDLALSPNPNEAAAAATKAMRLLQENSLTEETVRLRANGLRSKIAENKQELKNERGRWNKDGRSDFVTLIAKALARANYCKVLFAKSAVYFYGDAKTVKIVGFLFESLYNRLHQLAAEASIKERKEIKQAADSELAYRRRKGDNEPEDYGYYWRQWKQFSHASYRRAFLVGAGLAVAQRINQEKKDFESANTEAALVLVRDLEIDEFIAERVGKVRNFSGRKKLYIRNAAILQGRRAGESIEFQTGVTAGVAVAPALLTGGE